MLASTAPALAQQAPPAPGPITNDPIAAGTVAPGTITVAPPAGAIASPGERQAWAEAVGVALAQAGFTPLPDGAARYVARVSVTRAPRGEVAAGGSGLDASGGLGNWGASALVTLPSRTTQIRALMAIELTVEIARRGEQQPVWRGRALTVRPQGLPAAAAAQLAPRLADAALRGFPETRAEPATVP